MPAFFFSPFVDLFFLPDPSNGEWHDPHNTFLTWKSVSASLPLPKRCVTAPSLLGFSAAVQVAEEVTLDIGGWAVISMGSPSF